MQANVRSTGDRLRSMVQIALFADIIAVSAWIAIPTAIPFTLQTFAVFLTIGVLGGKKGAAAVCVYLLLGAIGLPVFAGGTAGIGVIAGYLGGYMIGWIFSALVMWLMERLLGKKRWVLALSMLLGLLVCYAFGTAWYMVVYARQTGQIGLWAAIGYCVVPFVIPDAIKLTAAFLLQKRLGRLKL